MSTLPIITSNMSYYGSIFILVIGLFGCLCNLITFTAVRLQCNPCAFYFLLSTIFEVCSITFGVISRMAADHLGSNLSSTSRAYCKLRAFLVSAIPLTATYLILMASIDRFMSSSVSARLRSFSQIKVAHRASILVTLIAWASCSHILVSYDLRPKCATQPGSYAKFDGLFVVIWLGFIPHVSMLTFGVLTIINIRRKMRRRALIAPISGNASTGVQHRRETKTEKHLVWVNIDKRFVIVIISFHVIFIYHLDDADSSRFQFTFDYDTHDLLCLFDLNTKANWL